MAVSANYSVPVHVNGFTCKNCTDVDYAKKHIDPAHPKSGPYNVDAKTDPTRTTEAIRYGGALAGLNSGAAQGPAGQTVPASASATGSQVDLLV